MANILSLWYYRFYTNNKSPARPSNQCIVTELKNKTRGPLGRPGVNMDWDDVVFVMLWHPLTSSDFASSSPDWHLLMTRHVPSSVNTSLQSPHFWCFLSYNTNSQDVINYTPHFLWETHKILAGMYKIGPHKLLNHLSLDIFSACFKNDLRLSTLNVHILMMEVRVRVRVRWGEVRWGVYLL